MESKSIILIAMAVLMGCNEAPTEVGKFVSEPPAERIAFQEGDLVIGEVRYACGSWVGGAPSADRITVDLSLNRESADVPNDAPTERQLQMIAEVGGVIRHTFNLGVVRVDLPASAIPILVNAGSSSGIADHARAVPDRGRFDLGLIVGYRGEVATIRDAFENSGGVVREVYTSLPAFHGYLPDSAIPAMRSTGLVRYIEHDGIACLT